MRSLRLTTAALALSLAVAATPLAADTLAYPTADDASFLIDYPSDWELVQAEEEGGYMELKAPGGGAVLNFRTIEGSEDAMQQAIADTVTYLKGRYSNVETSPAQDTTQHGLTGFFAGGTGVDESAGPIKFVCAWYGLNDGTIGEIWFVGKQDDAASAEAAKHIVNSFRPPE